MRLVSKNDFARLAQVTAPAVNNVLGTRLKDCVYENQIDLEHPDAILYIEDQIKRREEYRAGRVKSGRKAGVPPAKFDTDISKYLDLTLREIHEKHGTIPMFLGYLKAVREIEKIQETRLKNGEREGTLVSRELVKVAVLEPIDTAHTKLLTDGARSIARTLKQKFDSGADALACERWVSKRIGQFIKAAKSKSKRAIENA